MPVTVAFWDNRTPVTVTSATVVPLVMPVPLTSMPSIIVAFAVAIVAVVLPLVVPTETATLVGST